MHAQEVTDMTAENQKKYDAKMKRLKDALALKTPDKVPIDIAGGTFMVQRLGYTLAENNFDETLEIGKEAAKKFMLDFEPDTMSGLGNTYAGEGRGHVMQEGKTYYIAGMDHPAVGPDSMPQFMEFATLHEEDFELFRSDYTKWSLTKFLPQMSDVLKPFADLQFELNHRNILNIVDTFSTPDMRRCMQRIWEIADFYKEYRPKLARAQKELMELGFPSLAGGRALVPFDKYSDTFRGMVLSFVDIFEDEDFVMEYCEKFHKEQLEMLRNDNKDGRKDGMFVMMALHKGSDDMMGRNLYRKFYWNHLQEIIKTSHEAGMMCDLFCEGEYTGKLDILSEVERCSCYFAFDKIDIAKAKETVGKVCCIGGGFPTPLLVYATPDKVEEELKKFLDIAMKDGGYIFSLSAGINGAREENVERMFKVLHDRGRY